MIDPFLCIGLPPNALVLVFPSPVFVLDLNQLNVRVALRSSFLFGLLDIVGATLQIVNFQLK
jgi:hypothetical protein